MTSLIAASGSGRSMSVIPAVPAASSVTTIAFIGHLPVSSSRLLQIPLSRLCGGVGPVRPGLDAGACGAAPRGLRDRVLPGSLTAASHHEEIAVPDLEAQHGAARLRPEREWPD